MRSVCEATRPKAGQWEGPFPHGGLPGPLLRVRGRHPVSAGQHPGLERVPPQAHTGPLGRQTSGPSSVAGGATPSAQRSVGLLDTGAQEQCAGAAVSRRQCPSVRGTSCRLRHLRQERGARPGEGCCEPFPGVASLSKAQRGSLCVRGCSECLDSGPWRGALGTVCEATGSHSACSGPVPACDLSRRDRSTVNMARAQRGSPGNPGRLEAALLWPGFAAEPGGTARD